MLPQVILAERDALERRGVRTADEFGKAVEPEPTHDSGSGVVEQRGSGAANCVRHELPTPLLLYSTTPLLGCQFVLDEVAHVLHRELLSEILNARVGGKLG